MVRERRNRKQKENKGTDKGKSVSRPSENGDQVNNNNGNKTNKATSRDSNEERTDRSKRKRISTGGTSEKNDQITKEQFKVMNTDDKLVTLFEMMSSVKPLSERLNTVESTLFTVITENQERDVRLKTLEYKSIDQEARSRRNNLIFRGFPEVGLNENCEDTLALFVEEYLELDISNIYVQAAHRIGPPARNKDRPIICNFVNRKDVDLILSKAYKLKGTNYGINRDYPPEIVQARSRLWPLYKKLKAQNKKGDVFIGYPAKLIVKKKVIRDEFPDWSEIMQKQRAQGELFNTPTNTSERNKTSRSTPDEDFRSQNRFDVLMEADRSESEDSVSTVDESDTESSDGADQYSQAMRKYAARSRSPRYNTRQNSDDAPLNLTTRTKSPHVSNANNKHSTPSTLRPSGASGGPADLIRNATHK